METHSILDGKWIDGNPEAPRGNAILFSTLRETWPKLTYHSLSSQIQYLSQEMAKFSDTILSPTNALIRFARENNLDLVQIQSLNLETIMNEVGTNIFSSHDRIETRNHTVRSIENNLTKASYQYIQLCDEQLYSREGILKRPRLR